MRFQWFWAPKIINEAINRGALRNIYKTMQKEFDLKDAHSKIELSRNIFRSHDLEFQKRYRDAFVVGVDLSSLLERNNGCPDKKTVAILGQDPLRKSNRRVEEIGIATPYAMHSKTCRENLRAPRKIQILLRMAMRFQWFWAPKIINEAINRGAPK